MSGPYTILNARVQQKKGTEAEWLAQEAELGPILDGEQAFVVDTAGVGINFKIGDGTKLFSELPYFIQYNARASNIKSLPFIDANTDQIVTSVFRNFSCLYDIILINNSGVTLDFKVGTTLGGNEIMEISVPTGIYPISLRKVFQADTTVYFSGLAGHSYSMFLMYFQYDEAPATTSGIGSFRWPRCFKGAFEPLNDTDLDANWDFTTGRGIAGTVWENCAISGTNGTEDMGRFYPVGWKVGDSLRPATTFGNSGGLVTLTEENIPEHAHKMFSGAAPAGELLPDPDGTNAVAWALNVDTKRDYQMKKAADSNVSAGTTSKYGQAIPTAIDVRPLSKVCLYWVAISD
jgi:hypothetical protein